MLPVTTLIPFLLFFLLPLVLGWSRRRCQPATILFLLSLSRPLSTPRLLTLGAVILFSGNQTIGTHTKSHRLTHHQRYFHQPVSNASLSRSIIVSITSAAKQNNNNSDYDSIIPCTVTLLLRGSAPCHSPLRQIHGSGQRIELDSQHDCILSK